jgi:HECT-domain (ubiquitin-transferase)
MYCVGNVLSGAIYLPSLFARIPMEYINTMLFATQQVTAEEVIEVLSVSYDSNGILDSQMQILRKDDLGNWMGCFPDLLRRAEAAFVSDFVEFVTGSAFVPYMKKDYKITIEFNQAELESSDYLVVAHTCPNVLKIPGSA